MATKLKSVSRLKNILCEKYFPQTLSYCMSSNRAGICKTNRHRFAKTYPTIIALEDGSTINIRYHEPRRIIKLPEDLTKLSEAEKTRRLRARIPKEKIVAYEEEVEEYDAKVYAQYWQK